MSASELRGDPLISTPPASGWRSMASAPRDGKWFIVRHERDGMSFAGWSETRKAFVGTTLLALSDMIAWAPMPEWTGEVSE